MSTAIWRECPQQGCGYSAEAKTEAAVNKKMLTHLQRMDHAATMVRYRENYQPAPPKFVVGQKVITTSRTRIIEDVVTKVGRQYVYAGEGWRQGKYDIERGHQIVEYGSGGRIYTLDEYAEYERRSRILKRLEATKFRDQWYSTDKVSTDTLEKIVDLLEQDAAEQAK